MRPHSQIAATIVFVTALSVACATPYQALATGAAPPTGRVIVYLTPNPGRLYHPLTITVTGLPRGTAWSFWFSKIPYTAAFGGPMGTFRANGRGAIQFTHPAFIYGSEAGRWKVVARRAGGSINLTTLFRVAR